MGNPKDKEQNSDGTTGTSTDAVTNDACQASWDQSCERAVVIDKLVAEAITRESAWLTVTFTAILKESNIVNMPTSLKVTSGAAGIKSMPPFDWTQDKAIYQRSENARHALDLMKGDSVKAKISYFHHWIDSQGMAHIESWKNNKTLISQEDDEKLDETL